MQFVTGREVAGQSWGLGGCVARGGLGPGGLIRPFLVPRSVLAAPGPVILHADAPAVAAGQR